jgi:hypothetical protein
MWYKFLCVGRDASCRQWVTVVMIVGQVVAIKGQVEYVGQISDDSRAK